MKMPVSVKSDLRVARLGDGISPTLIWDDREVTTSHMNPRLWQAWQDPGITEPRQVLQSSATKKQKSVVGRGRRGVAWACTLGLRNPLWFLSESQKPRG